MLKLLVSTDKKLNELTKAELASVDWKSVQLGEYDYVDTATYRKLNAEGRIEVNSVVYFYSSRPEEYWDEVLKHKVRKEFVENFLYNADDIKTMYHRYEDLFNKYVSSKRLYDDLGLMSFSAYIRKDGYDVLEKSDSYYIMLDPAIPVSEYLEPYNDKKTTLQHLISEMRDNYTLDDYPILVSNEVLYAAGGFMVPDFTDFNMKKYGACSGGRDFVKHWKEKLGLTEKNELTWDIVVKYIRENPSTIVENDNNPVVEYLNWWWEETVSNTGN